MPRSSSRSGKHTQAAPGRKRARLPEQDNTLESVTGNGPKAEADADSQEQQTQSKRLKAPPSPDDFNDEDGENGGNNDSSPTSAVIATQRTGVQRGVPAFLNKLYSMVSESSTDNLIRWSADGTSFVVENHEVFAKTVLPRYYKHNTFASFVRQLNMYDFHKVPTVQQGVLFPESERVMWEFSNENFRRGRPDLLLLVTRKRTRDRESSDGETVTLASLVKDITAIQQHQKMISTDLRSLQKDNSILWQESLAAREKHQLHKDVIEKILQFLTAVFSSEHNILAATAQQINGPFMLGKDNEYISLLGKAGQGDIRGSLEGRLPTALIEEAAQLAGVKPLQGFGSISGTDDPVGSSSSTAPSTVSSASSIEPAGELKNFTETLNSASRSAEAITQDIDELEADIEALAANIGIDTNRIGDGYLEGFGSEYESMIMGASRSDKIRLYELAGGSHVKNKYDGSSPNLTKGKEATVPVPVPVLSSTAALNTSEMPMVGGSLPVTPNSAQHPEIPVDILEPPRPTSVSDTAPCTNIPPTIHLGAPSGSNLRDTPIPQTGPPFMTTSLFNHPLYQNFSIPPGIPLPSLQPGQPQQQYVAVPVPIPVPVPMQQYQEQQRQNQDNGTGIAASAAAAAVTSLPHGFQSPYFGFQLPYPQAFANNHFNSTAASAKSDQQQPQQQQQQQQQQQPYPQQSQQRP
ncbi:hypothetical protein BX666DRAFT_1965098 [Dichotomocladium elegans]|nr:hypothetical protein BX666DRAFT_1965098 [Dichotomocladium elegans]